MHHQDESGKRMYSSDEYLLELAVGGDTSSFGVLVERWERKIYGFVRRYIGNSEEAKDLTQDTFAKAFQNLDRLADRKRFSSWLYTIALNECRMKFRRQKRAPATSLDENEEVVEQVSRDNVTPESLLGKKEAVRQLQEVFQDLPPEQREVILMKEYQGLRFHEIAEILEIPLSTAKSRMYLGLKALRRLMEERYEL